MKKAYKMKGQAFIVFKDVQQAGEAMRSLQKFTFFGKELNIQYAKSQSEIIAKKEGRFDPIAKKRARMAGQKIKETQKEEEIKEPDNKTVHVYLIIDIRLWQQMCLTIYCKYRNCQKK